MTTAEAIAGITDSGQFEILATRVLKLSEPDCADLEHMGVNATGKTVKNPVDGFCRVRSANRFVYVAFTTDKIETLERKWVYDHSKSDRSNKATDADDGDVIKASRAAAALRADHPDAEFVVHLCTNKQPDEDMVAQALTVGANHKLSVRFLTQSKLRDFLDVNPDGQWLRKVHLGIEADRVSLELLRSLSEKSLVLFRQDLLLDADLVPVSTQSERALAMAVESGAPICIVRGASGTGKSVACYQQLASHVAEGLVGFWIPSEIIANAPTLESAIGSAVRELHPLVEVNAGANALAVGSKAKRIAIVVDDINRSRSPSEVLRKLVAWCGPQKAASGGGTGGSQNPADATVILVPTWDAVWSSVNEEYRAAKWIQEVVIAEMSEAEALACFESHLGAKSHALADADKKQIVEALGRDPVLITLFSQSLKPDVPATSVLAHQVIDGYVRNAASQTSAAHEHLPEEYVLAMTRLGSWQLTNRNLRPSWTALAASLPTGDLQALREMAKVGKVCRIVDRGNGAQLEFRHDRILEHFLVRALAPLLQAPMQNSDILADPYYIPYVGRALSDSAPTPELLEWLAANAPLALISCLQGLAGMSLPDSALVQGAASEWLSTAAKENLGFLVHAAIELLEGTEAARVVNVQLDNGYDRLLSRARLASGDPRYIVGEFSTKSIFYPAVNDYRLEAQLGRALHRHRSSMVNTCAAILENHELDERWRRGALILAGYIGDKQLSGAVDDAWRISKDRPGTVLAALWAALRCSVSASGAVLDDILSAWAELDNGDQNGMGSVRTRLAQELQFASRWGFPLPALAHLVARARTDERLRWPITFGVQRVDHPLIVDFLATEAADRLKGKSEFSHWTQTLGEQWDPLVERRGKRLSSESLLALRSLWEFEAGDAQLRETAFKMWVRCVDDVEALRAIPESQPSFSSALWRRVLLGDLSATDQVAERLTAHPHWFSIINRIWSEGFAAALDAEAERLSHLQVELSDRNSNDSYGLANVFRDIPPESAQPVLLKYWGLLKANRLFVQAALYIGSPECAAAAAAAVAELHPGGSAFPFVSMYFGFRVTGLQTRLQRRHLDALLPFIGDLDDHTLADIAEFCAEKGYFDWAIKNLSSEVTRRASELPAEHSELEGWIEQVRQEHFPKDEDLRLALTRIEADARHDSLAIRRWSEAFKRRRDPHARWQGVLKSWLLFEPTVRRLEIVAAAIAFGGTRGDLALIEGVTTEDPVAADRVRSAVAFAVKRRTVAV